MARSSDVGDSGKNHNGNYHMIEGLTEVGLALVEKVGIHEIGE